MNLTFPCSICGAAPFVNIEYCETAIVSWQVVQHEPTCDHGHGCDLMPLRATA